MTRACRRPHGHGYLGRPADGAAFRHAEPPLASQARRLTRRCSAGAQRRDVAAGPADILLPPARGASQLLAPSLLTETHCHAAGDQRLGHARAAPGVAVVGCRRQPATPPAFRDLTASAAPICTLAIARAPAREPSAFEAFFMSERGDKKRLRARGRVGAQHGRPARARAFLQRRRRRFGGKGMTGEGGGWMGR